MTRVGKTIIVCASVAHGNTRSVADVIADVLEARVVTVEEAAGVDLADYDLVGFGSGIYWGSFHSSLRELVAGLSGAGGRAFLFATSGFADTRLHSFSKPMLDALERKGFEVVGGFSSRGFDTFGPFKLIGGIRKGRPDEDDLRSARGFAEYLRDSVESDR